MATAAMATKSLESHLQQLLCSGPIILLFHQAKHAEGITKL
jgi:hypothetical protein